MSKTLTFAQILSSPVCLQPPPSSSLSRSLFLLRWSFLSSFLKRLSKSWQLTKIFQTQLRKSPKTTTKTTMSTSLVHSGAAMAWQRRHKLNSTHSSFLTSNTRGSESPFGFEQTFFEKTEKRGTSSCGIGFHIITTAADVFKESVGT